MLRGLIVAGAGFLFIFAPGLPMRLLQRARGPLPRGLLYWGIGAWLLSQPLALFFKSLLRQAVHGAAAVELAGRPGDYLFTLGSALVGALLLMVVLTLVVRSRGARGGDRREDGLAAGFGVGLIAQVFTGLHLVGAGFRLAFGQTEGPTLGALAAAPWGALLLTLLALVLFRLALLTVSAAEGLLAARAAEGAWGAFSAGVALEAGFVWLLLALHMALGVPTPGQVLAGLDQLGAAALSAAYFLMAFAAAYVWVRRDAAASADARRAAPRGAQDE